MEKTIIRGTKVLYGEHSIRVRIIRSNSNICQYPLYIVTLQNDGEAPIAADYSLREYKAVWDYCGTLTNIFCNKYDTTAEMIRLLKGQKKYFLGAIKDLGYSDRYKLDTISVDNVEPDRATVDTIEPDRVSIDGTTEGKIYCTLMTDQIPEENYTNCDNEDSFSELCYRID